MYGGHNYFNESNYYFKFDDGSSVVNYSALVRLI